MTEQEKFLELLAENEDNTKVRLIYADWLDEHGAYDEADRQRAWPAAKEWLVRFCETNRGEEYEWDLDYPTLVALATEAYEDAKRDGGKFDEITMHCGNNMTMIDALYGNKMEFWKNWSIVTGNPLPGDLDEKAGFSCAC